MAIPHHFSHVNLTKLKSLTKTLKPKTNFTSIRCCHSTAPGLRSRLASNAPLYGLFLLSNSPTIAEIAGLAGYDYVVIDMEHGPGGISDTLSCLRALSTSRTPAILRLPDLSASWAKKALDIGPQGIMFPMVNDAQAAAAAVSYCRFPPKGIRGSAHGVVRASQYGFNEKYLDWCEEELLVMCQVETAEAVDEIEAIAAVDGVGALQIGPRDLSASMGCLANPGDGKVREKLREAERRALGAMRGGKGPPYLAGMATPLDKPEELLAKGYHMVANGVDLALFRNAAVEDVKKWKTAVAAATAADMHGNSQEQPHGQPWTEVASGSVPKGNY